MFTSIVGIIASRLAPAGPGTPVYQVVNIDAIANAGLSSSVGITVSNLNPSTTYRLSLPPSQMYTAWNNGVSWLNRFMVTTTAGAIEYGSDGYFASPELARQGFPDTFVTGYSSYTFWFADSYVPDNSGGLSILIQDVL